MARFGLSQEVVHEIDVTDERGVTERCVDWGRLAAADQRAGASAAEFRDLLATGLNGARAEGCDAAPEGVEDMDGQLLARRRREIVESGAGGVAGEGLDLRPFLQPARLGPGRCLLGGSLLGQRRAAA